MKSMFLPIVLICSVCHAEPKVVFDDRPQSGVPQEAREQMRADSGMTRAELKQLYATLTAQKNVKLPATMHDATGTIKTIRIRYFNKKTWKSEDDVRDYVRGFLADKSSTASDTQMWSQLVGVPEIECLVDFTDEYRKKLIGEKKDCRVGRLLMWQTEACFRDATGRWWFVSAFNQFHRAHPKGDRRLAKPLK